MRSGFIFVIVTGLTACGSGQPVEASGEGTAGLTSTPISFADATGENSKMVEVGPCPFVSDETIKASVRTTFEITRREVSNTNCRWAYNAGFVIEVTIEDLATAKPISERRYNMDIDPVLAPQDGPGTNATILNDTAWDKPLPYAYSFEKDGKLVFIRYTGFKTNPAIMRPAANEIAQRMDTAPEIEQQRRELLVPFEPCEVWSESDLKMAFGTSDAAIVSRAPGVTTTCSWKIREEGVSGTQTASFRIYKPEPGKKQEYEYDSYASYTADGETHYLRESPSDFGLYVFVVTPRPEGIVYVTVSDANNNPTDVGKALQKNLLDRMVP